MQATETRLQERLNTLQAQCAALATLETDVDVTKKRHDARVMSEVCNPAICIRIELISSLLTSLVCLSVYGNIERAQKEDSEIEN